MPKHKLHKFDYVQLIGIPANIMLAENAADGGKQLPKFNLIAYTGAPVNSGWSCPVIIDLAGIQIPKQHIPVRFNHDSDKGVGHTEKIVIENGQVLCEGVFSRETEYAKDIITAAKNGFPWQVSVGCVIQKYRRIEKDESVNVNGQTFSGECYVLSNVILKEVSFVDLGADAETSADIKLFCVLENQSENQENVMSKTENATLKASEQPSGTTSQPDDDKAGAVSAAAVYLSADQQLAENRRISAITHYGGNRKPELEAKAIEDGWSFAKFQSELNAALMPSGSVIQTSGDAGKSLNAQTLEVIALRQAGSNAGFLEKHYKPETLELADRYSGAGIEEFVALACCGTQLPKYKRDPHGWLSAAFSSASLPNIMSNVVNKVLLESFESMDNEWKKITSVGSPKDFKKYTNYRLTSDFKFQKVAADGEIKHGMLGEESYENNVDTHGIMFSLTRRDIINDDLGALTSLPKQIGMGAAYAINDAVWGLLLSNRNNFFSAAHKNLITGENLDAAGFSTAKTAFALQEFSKGRPLNIQPRYLAVPTALEYDATALLTVSNFTTGGGDTPVTVVKNPYYKSVELISTPYLQSEAFTGASETNWYLFANPNQLSAFEVAFLNGKQHPAVEQAEADFNTLGIQFRGYIDFGVAAQDYRAALKITA